MVQPWHNFVFFPEADCIIIIICLSFLLVIGTTYLAEQELGIVMCPMFSFVSYVVWFSPVTVHAHCLHLN